MAFKRAVGVASAGLVLLALLCLGGCASSGHTELVAADNGREIKIGVGETIAVTLDANPTTGYTWQRAPADDGILEQEGEPEYVERTSGQQRVGAGGQQVLRFSAQESGTTELSLEYRRPWEENVEPEASFSVQVTVR
jgi:inhibitor of cysteine peptidase